MATGWPSGSTILPRSSEYSLKSLRRVAVFVLALHHLPVEGRREHQEEEGEHEHRHAADLAVHRATVTSPTPGATSGTVSGACAGAGALSWETRHNSATRA